VEGTTYASAFDERGFAYRPSRDAGPLARISTTSLTRGGRALPIEPGAWTGEGSVASRALRDGVDERVTVSSTGIEWDVVLAERPAGTGDLTVRARLSGVAGTVRRPGGDSIGLRLADGRVVEMGELVVVDATGAELLRQLPEVTGDRIELTVPSRVLDRASYPLVLDPTFYGGLLMNDDWEGSGSPSLAWNGTKTLAVWRNNRQVQASLLAPDTSSRGATFVVSGTAGIAHTPDVAWNGSSFLVVWANQVSNANYDLYAQRVGANGTKLGDQITVAVHPNMQMTPAVTAMPGGSFLVVWDDNRNSSTGPKSARDIYGQRISSAGVPQDGTGFRISTDTTATKTNDLKPDVTTNGSTTMVVWEAVGMAAVTYKSIYKAFVPVTGAPTQVAPAATNGDPGKPVQDPAIASDGSSYVVVYEDRRGPADADTDLNAIRLDAAGTVKTKATVSGAAGHQDVPSIAFAVDRYLVLWIDRRNDPNGDVFGADVTADLAVAWPIFVNDTYQTSTVTAVAPATSDPKWSGPNFTIAWQDQPAGYPSGVLAFGVDTSTK
jgi:hypothetical protein